MLTDLELLPCANCGGSAKLEEVNTGDKARYVVECQVCVMSTSAPMWSKQVASGIWNRRPDKKKIPTMPKPSAPIMRIEPVADSDYRFDWCSFFIGMSVPTLLGSVILLLVLSNN